MTLLKELHEQKRIAREQLRLATRSRCRQILRALLPAGTEVIVFGSLVKPFAFNPWSDVDLAFGELPGGLTLAQLAIRLEAELHRSIDIVMIDRTRLKAAILRTGERWTL